MKPILRAAAFAVLLPTLSATAIAQSDTTPEDLAIEGLSRLMQAIELFVDTLPMYETPEVLPNGDILIRRVQSDEETKPSEDSGDDTVSDT